MTEFEYKTLQERLNLKIKNNPYRRTGCTNYQTGYKEGILAAKSIISSYFNNHSAQLTSLE